MAPSGACIPPKKDAQPADKSPGAVRTVPQLLEDPMEAVAPAPNRESIVAEPPPQTHWLLPLIFVGGVGYAWHLWNQAAHRIARAW